MTTFAPRKRTRGDMSDSKSQSCIAPSLQVHRPVVGVCHLDSSVLRGQQGKAISSRSVIIYCEDKQWNVCLFHSVSSVLLALREQCENGVSSDEGRDQSSSDAVLVRSNGSLDVLVG